MPLCISVGAGGVEQQSVPGLFQRTATGAIVNGWEEIGDKRARSQRGEYPAPSRGMVGR